MSTHNQTAPNGVVFQSRGNNQIALIASLVKYCICFCKVASRNAEWHAVDQEVKKGLQNKAMYFFILAAPSNVQSGNKLSFIQLQVANEICIDLMFQKKNIESCPLLDRQIDIDDQIECPVYYLLFYPEGNSFYVRINKNRNFFGKEKKRHRARSYTLIHIEQYHTPQEVSLKSIIQLNRNTGIRICLIINQTCLASWALLVLEGVDMP